MLFDIVRDAFFAAALYQSYVVFKVAYDPPDKNYTEIALPETMPFPEFTGIPPDSPIIYFLAKELEILSLQRAHAKSIDRYVGAMKDGNTQWMVTQYNAAFNYSKQIAEKSLALLPLYFKISSLLPDATDKEILDAKNRIINSDVQEMLGNVLAQETEITADEISKIKEFIISLDSIWFKSKNIGPYLALVSWHLNDLIADSELKKLVNYKTSLLGENYEEPTNQELNSLSMQKAEIEGVFNSGNFTPDVINKIDLLRKLCEQIISRTNNYKSLEAFITFTQEALEKCL